MRVLMLTPYLPFPPTDGGQIRSFNLIKHLSKRHEISLFSYIRYRDRNQETDVGELRKYCRKVEVVNRGKTWTLSNVLRTGFGPYPFLISIYHSPQLKEKIRQELERDHYDLIHAETFYVMPYIPPTGIPVVLVEQTINHQVFGDYVRKFRLGLLKPLLWIDVLKLKFWESYYWRKANMVTAVSEADARLMRSLVPSLKVPIIANGAGEDFEGLPSGLHYNHDVLFLGNYKWLQNWEAADILAKKVFPLIKREIPDARLIIAGQFIKDDLKKYESSDVEIKELEPGDSKSVVETTLNSGILVAPIYGPGGTRLKVLAAMASMLPAVTTPIAAEGLSLKHEESVMIGETPEELADCAVRLFKERKLYEEVAKNAKRIVESHYTWDAISKKLEKVYREVVRVREH